MPLATLSSPIYPRHPHLPKGAKGTGTMLNHRVGQLTTNPTARRESVRQRVCIGKNASPQPGQCPLEVVIGDANGDLLGVS